MILLIKALILKYKKTVGILVITMFIVLSSLHVFNSFTNSGEIIGEELTLERVYHAKVQMNHSSIRSDPIENIQAWHEVYGEMETLIESHGARFIKQRREPFGHLYFDEGDYERGLDGYDQDKMEKQDLSFDLIPWEDKVKDSFVTYKGKDIHTLEGNEVAISRDLEMTFKSLGVEALGYEIVTYYHHLYVRYPEAPLLEDIDLSEFRIITY